MTTRHDAGDALAALMQDGPVLVPGCYDCLSAAVLERVGFPALFLSGAGVAASAAGLPDLGLTSLGELLTVAGNVIARAGVPVIVDADTGFGNELNATRTIEELGRRGAAAVTIEDQVFPKRCGHLGAKQVVAVDEFTAKIRAARRACDAAGMLLIARTDALGLHGVEDAVARGRAAVDAGAHVVFVEAPRTVEDVERIAAGVPGPKLYNLATGGVSPALPIDSLGRLGFDLVIEPGAALMPAVSAIRAAGAEILQTRTGAPLERIGLTPPDVFEEVGLSEWLRREAELAAVV
jgi:2-methylisocitrate lyase-like PEP mutase family enzyme